MAITVLKDAIVAGILSEDTILMIFHGYLDCKFSFAELDELPRNTPNIQEYDIDLERYNKFLRGR